MKTTFVKKKSEKVRKQSLIKCIRKHPMFETCCLVTFSRLATHFCCGHNVRRFARGDCIFTYSCFVLL